MVRAQNNEPFASQTGPAVFTMGQTCLCSQRSDHARAVDHHSHEYHWGRRDHSVGTAAARASDVDVARPDMRGGDTLSEAELIKPDFTFNISVP